MSKTAMLYKTHFPQQAQCVETVSFLSDGTQIQSREEIEKYFFWVNENTLAQLNRLLRFITENNRKSVIAIHQDKRIICYPNVERNFDLSLIKN